PEGPGPLGVRLALGNLLPVEMGHLLKEMDVVEQDGAVGADGQRIAVARRGCAGAHRRAPGGSGHTHLHWPKWPCSGCMKPPRDIHGDTGSRPAFCQAWPEIQASGGSNRSPCALMS